jgi:hypothetical protein
MSTCLVTLFMENSKCSFNIHSRIGLCKILILLFSGKTFDVPYKMQKHVFMLNIDKWNGPTMHMGSNYQYILPMANFPKKFQSCMLLHHPLVSLKPCQGNISRIPKCHGFRKTTLCFYTILCCNHVCFYTILY